MDKQQRLSKIDELIKEINPLNYERILLDTKLYFTEKQPEKDDQEIQELKTKIQELHDHLTPLFQQLRSLQCQYEIEFQGELMRADGTHYWNDPEIRVFNLRTCCNVDTFAQTWGPYINDPCVNDLIMEVHQVIYQQFYTNFNILNIRRI